MTYYYSVLRYVPNTARREFVNLGIIAGSDDSADWAMEWVPKSTLANRLGDRETISAALQFMASLSSDIDEFRDALDMNITAKPPLTLDQLQTLSDESRGIVQFSAPMPVVAETAKDSIEALFNTLVESPATRDTRQGKEKAKSMLLEAYRDERIPTNLVQRRPRLTSEENSFDFDFAVVNGSTVQLVQTLSFRIKTEYHLVNELRSWAWSVKRLRDVGGNLLFGQGRTAKVDSDVNASLVFVQPEAQENKEAWGIAQEVVNELRITSVPAQDARKVAEIASRLLTKS